MPVLLVIERSCILASRIHFIVFFFNDTATTEIYTLSLHDALPIFTCRRSDVMSKGKKRSGARPGRPPERFLRSEERFSRNAETDLVCRLLLEKKKSNWTKPRTASQAPNQSTAACKTRITSINNCAN